MKTLTEIKNEVANDKYDCTFLQACTFMRIEDTEDFMNEVTKRYATEAIKADRERTTHAATEKYKETGMTNTASNVKEIILNLPIELK